MLCVLCKYFASQNTQERKARKSHLITGGLDTVWPCFEEQDNVNCRKDLEDILGNNINSVAYL